MYVNIEDDDLFKIESILLKDLKNDENKLFSNNRRAMIGSVIVIASTVSLFIVYAVFNNRESTLTVSVDFLKSILFLSIVSVVCTFGILFYKFNTAYLTKDKFFHEYEYLIDNFFVYIENNHLMLESKYTKIKIKLHSENIKLKEDTLVLFKENKFIAIVPLYKMKNSDEFLNDINKLVEVGSYDL